jgi:hypothetical protein
MNYLEIVPFTDKDRMGGKGGDGARDNEIRIATHCLARKYTPVIPPPPAPFDPRLKNAHTMNIRRWLRRLPNTCRSHASQRTN